MADVEGLTNLVIGSSATQLSIAFETILSSGTWTTPAFNGPLFTLSGPGTLGIASVSVNAATTMPGFDVSRVFLSETAIGLEWNGLSYVDGTKVVIDVTFRDVAVPGPAPFALLLFGIAGLTALRRGAARA